MPTLKNHLIKAVYALAAVLCLHGVAHAVEVKCDQDPAKKYFLPERLTYQVAGAGRLYLYSAPSEKCLNKNLFVVPGDLLTAYEEYGGNSEWTSVMYMSKEGKDYTGWVSTKRLMLTGAFGPDMSPNALKFYEKAVAAAKAGKLGSPWSK